MIRKITTRKKGCFMVWKHTKCQLMYAICNFLTPAFNFFSNIAHHKNLALHNHSYPGISFFHFSFLRDSKVHGIYYNSLTLYLNHYPFLKKEHIHDFYSVIMFTKGDGYITLNNNQHSIHPQTMCLIAPGQIHSFEGLENAEGQILLFCQDFYVEEFSFLRLLNLFSCTSELIGNTSNPSIALSDTEFFQVNEIIKSIDREYECYTPSNNSAQIIRSLLNIMLLKLSEQYNTLYSKSNNGDSLIIHELSHLVDSYFIKEHHIGFYTTAFNVSDKHLNDICKRNFNCGLKKILADRLMQEARKLLLSSELSVSQISYKLNFEDNSYFNKVFKKETGLTPKRFRTLHKKFVP
jgi:AraC family transcriptional activator of pobA